MSNSPPWRDEDDLSQELRIDELCTRFDRRLRGGKRPKIERYLDQADAAIRPRVLCELILVELEFYGWELDVALRKYIKRFPEYKQHIRAIDRLRATPSACVDVGSPSRRGRPAGNCGSLRAERLPGQVISERYQMLLARRKELKLGKYKLLEHLGYGGMGAVFKAEKTPRGRIVAIKLMDKSLVQDRTAAARFQREARAAAALNHPNIIAALGAGSAGDVHFLVMEYTLGEDLGALLERRGRLPVNEACEYARQAANGLQHVHEYGLVHRDIKPSNLLIAQEPNTSSPVVKILDLGLSKFVSEVVAAGELTKTGEVLGTVDYISPEQAQNAKSADIRSDVYSLGCTLFRMLTGQALFAGKGMMAKLMARAANEAPCVRSLRPDVPESLEAVLAQALARDPIARFQTPKQMVEALTPFTTVPM